VHSLISHVELCDLLSGKAVYDDPNDEIDEHESDSNSNPAPEKGKRKRRTKEKRGGKKGKQDTGDGEKPSMAVTVPEAVVADNVPKGAGTACVSEQGDDSSVHMSDGGLYSLGNGSGMSMWSSSASELICPCLDFALIT
jgi:hypothetical protein